jgi:hypothetical protein
MQFEGSNLREVISRTADLIEVHNAHGRCCQRISSTEALALDLDLFVGVGNRRRLRFLRRRTQKFNLNGNRTTRRVTGESGEHIAHPLILEHKSVRR